MRWGKSTTKKVKTRSGRKVRRTIKCGEWCQLCMDMFRIRFLRKYAKLNKKNPLKEFKKDLRADNALKLQWKAWNKEAIRQKATGRQRLNHGKLDMVRSTTSAVNVREPAKQFYTIKAFKREFGVDAKKAKMKIKDFKYKGKDYKGVFVSDPAKEGVFEVQQEERQEVSTKDQVDDGDLVLDARHFDDRMREEEADFKNSQFGGCSIEEVQRKVAEALDAERGSGSKTKSNAKNKIKHKHEHKKERWRPGRRPTATSRRKQF